jgi:multicomponent Na+:H+ antiporter subunit F
MSELFFVSALLLGIFIALTFIRVIFSANVPERIVALDSINTIVIVILIVVGAMLRKPLYIDIGIVYGIISFIGTLYIARYLEKKKGM